jgi:hypothetical protein
VTLPEPADRFETPLAALSPAILLLRRNGRVEIGSSTLVRVGHRFLLATAAHNVDDVADDEIRIVPSGLSAATPLAFVRRSRRRRGDPADVAWIELDAETVANRGLGFVGLAGVGGPPGAGERCYLVQGYPAQGVLHPPRAGFPVRAMGFFTVARAARHGDVAVAYPPPAGENERAGEPPHPHGISGGGIWSWPRDGAGGRHEGARLVAIARGWRRWRGALHGTPIEDWLARVAAELPDLRRAVAAQLESAPEGVGRAGG